MATEIEKKFLVVGEDWRRLGRPEYYQQAYLSIDKGRTVRVRIVGEVAWLTIKGLRVGLSRSEFEYEIPLDDARQMMRLCVARPVEKYRYKIPFENVIWEVDEFLTDNAGLVTAEVELEAEDQVVDLPDWIGAEVTTDARYANSNLAKKPYCEWD